jgi:hypothetical protein
MVVVKVSKEKKTSGDRWRLDIRLPIENGGTAQVCLDWMGCAFWWENLFVKDEKLLD